MGDLVAVVRHRGDLSTQARSETLGIAMKLIGGFKSLRSPFVIKPNLCTHPLWDVIRFATTDAKMVEALARLVLKEDPQLSIRVVESDSNDKFADEEIWKRYGYKDLVERFRDSGYDVSHVNLSQQPLVRMRTEGRYFKELEINELLSNPMYFASVAIAKTHTISYVTGVIKNLFGLLPKKGKGFYHPRDSTNFNDVIVDLARFVTPDLCIVDAIVGMEGTVPRRMDVLVVGRKPVSVDATMARIMGFEPDRIRHLVEAETYGLGSLHPEIVGELLESVTIKFKPIDKAWPIALIA